MSDYIQLIAQIPHRRTDNAWLEENRQAAFEAVQKLSEQNNWEQAAEVLIYLLPQLVTNPDFKRWGRLTEAVFSKSPFDASNGFDGEATAPIVGDYVFQKSEAPKQLPTKTVRRKRILTHHTQVLEMYLIMVAAKYFNNPTELDDSLVKDILAFARSINAPSSNAKLYQILAYIYAYGGDGYRAIRLGELAYHYYEALNDYLETGQSACAVFMGYMKLKDEAEAQPWAELAAEAFSRTDTPNRKCFV